MGYELEFKLYFKFVLKRIFREIFKETANNRDCRVLPMTLSRERELIKYRDELDDFIREQMNIFREIALKVKDYFDTFLMDAGMDDLDQVDKSFYYAFILEISRSIFINWSVYKRHREGFKQEKNNGLR